MKFIAIFQYISIKMCTFRMILIYHKLISCFISISLGVMSALKTLNKFDKKKKLKLLMMRQCFVKDLNV